MSQVVFVLNPRAAGGRAARLGDELRNAVQHGVDGLWIESEDPDEAGHKLGQALDHGALRVVAIGGDGTARAVAEVLLKRGLGRRVTFGLVPVGTGSDFARSLDLPKDPLQALDLALHRPGRPIDAIAVETDGGRRSFCLNIASAGLSGAVDLEVNRRRGASGPLSYLLPTLGALASYRPAPCRVWADGRLLVDGPFFVVAMANGRYFGKGMKVAPNASVDDGLLDVVVVPPVPLWQLPWRLPQFYSGRHVRVPGVLTVRASEVRVEPPSPFFPYDLDGETLDAEAAGFRLLPGALRFVSGGPEDR